jgi:hypothetical protein
MADIVAPMADILASMADISVRFWQIPSGAADFKPTGYM